MFINIVILFVGLLIYNTTPLHANDVTLQDRFWQIQSVDTMKQSRDMAREKLNDQSYDAYIAQAVKQIAQTGVTHIALGTPYDEEFQPYLQRWLREARNNNLKVWFRGNWSGWEGWFDYPKITPEEHINKTTTFIKNHPDYFQSGDIFSPCPECENGVIGDPRDPGNKENYSKFLVKEYKQVEDAFRYINKDIQVNYSMNGDVAKLVMDKATTKNLGGIVVIDHYVKTPEELIEGIDILAKQSNGKVLLGEWGFPIPGINGAISEEEQQRRINSTLDQLSKNSNLIGMNYWVGYGGSTALWNDTGVPKKAVGEINRFYRPLVLSGTVVDRWNNPIEMASVSSHRKAVTTDTKGRFSMPFIQGDQLEIRASGYKEERVELNESSNNFEIKLEDDQTTFLNAIVRFFSSMITKLKNIL